MKTTRYYIINSLTLYRLLAAPMMLILVSTGQESIFKWMLPISFFTDLIDGFLARRFHVASKWGSFIDSIADDLTIVAGVAGMVVFKWPFVKQQYFWIVLLLALFLIQMILALVRYKKISSFHTYLAKISAILQGLFLILIFLFQEPFIILWYLAIGFTMADLLEEIILVILLPTWETNVKGMYWVMKRKPRNRS